MKAFMRSRIPVIICLVFLICLLSFSAYAAWPMTFDLHDYYVSLSDAAITAYFDMNGLTLARDLYAHSIISDKDVFYGSGDYDSFLPLPEKISNAIRENAKFKEYVNQVKELARMSEQSTAKVGFDTGNPYSVLFDNNEDLKYSVAMADVSIDIDYVRESDSYNIWIVVTDTYDFEWEDCAFLDFTCYGNNLSYLKQQFNMLHNFGVSLCFNYSE